MKTVRAKIAGRPRTVNTRYGERSVITCFTEEGQTISVWRPKGDALIMHRTDGERVSLSIDGRGKATLVETAETRAVQARQAPMGFRLDPLPEPALLPLPETQFDPEPEPEPEPCPPTIDPRIADHVDRLAGLYAHCWRSALEHMGDSGLDKPQLKDISTTLFIEICRKRNI